MANPDSAVAARQYANVYKMNPTDLSPWLEKLSKDPSKFLDLFLEMQLVPDIGALHEWARWITPVNSRIRFDTVFFKCFLAEMPNEKLFNLNLHEHDELEVRP